MYVCISHNVTEVLHYLKRIKALQIATSIPVTMNINSPVARQLMAVASNVDKLKEA